MKSEICTTYLGPNDQVSVSLLSNQHELLLYISMYFKEDQSYRSFAVVDVNDTTVLHRLDVKVGILRKHGGKTEKRQRGNAESLYRRNFWDWFIPPLFTFLSQDDPIHWFFHYNYPFPPYFPIWLIYTVIHDVTIAFYSVERSKVHRHYTVSCLK